MVKKVLASVFLAAFVAGSAWADLSGNFRSFYLNRYYSTPASQESLAVGGWLQYDAQVWQGVNLRLAAYTSQGSIFTDSNHGGGGLLTPAQKGYLVLGQANLNAKAGKTDIILFRQALDTPFINTFDVKMTPVLVEAYTVKSQLSPKASVVFSHLTKIKGWTETEFKPLSNKPVSLGGLVLAPRENIQLQVWEYFCDDFMNVMYTQADGNWQLPNGNIISASFQSFDQRSLGQAIGGNFTTGMYGLQAKYTLSKGPGFSLAFTSTNKNHDIVNPWGAYPGFTSIIEEDNDLAGEQAVTVGGVTDFGKVGPAALSASLYHTRSYLLDKGSFADPDQLETDLTLSFQFDQHLILRLRGAVVNNSLDTGRANYTSFRAIINHDF
ncbi:MAG: OprD family outer membrane porin [bacterium]